MVSAMVKIEKQSVKQGRVKRLRPSAEGAGHCTRQFRFRIRFLNQRLLTRTLVSGEI